MIESGTIKGNYIEAGSISVEQLDIESIAVRKVETKPDSTGSITISGNDIIVRDVKSTDPVVKLVGDNITTLGQQLSNLTTSINTGVSVNSVSLENDNFAYTKLNTSTINLTAAPYRFSSNMSIYTAPTLNYRFYLEDSGAITSMPSKFYVFARIDFCKKGTVPSYSEMGAG
jgi:hypothetical protein